MTAPLQTSQLRHTNWFKAFSANQTTTTAQTDDIVEALPTDGRIIPVKSYSGGPRWRGVEILPFGGDDDNDEFRIIVEHIAIVDDWGRDTNSLYDFDYDLDVQYLKRAITNLDCTINTNAGLAGTAGGYVGSGDSCCDVIAQTRTTFGTALESAFGQTSVIYTGAGNSTFGSYWLPDMGEPDYLRLYVDIDGGSGTAADEGNCLVRFYV